MLLERLGFYSLAKVGVEGSNPFAGSNCRVSNPSPDR